MRAVIVRNMPFFETELMRNVINRSVYRNLDHYLSVTRMYCDGAWGGDPDIQTLVALLNTTICDPRKKVPLGAIINYSVWCRKVNTSTLSKTIFLHRAIKTSISYLLIPNL